MQKRELHNGTENLRLFGENPLPMWIYDPITTLLLAANNAFLKQYQYKKNEIEKLSIIDFVSPEERVKLADFSQKIKDKTFSDSGIWLHRKKNGEQFYVKVTSHLTSINGKKARMVVAIDIDEQIKTKNSVELSEKKLQTLIDNTSDFIYMVDINLNVTTANLALAEKIRQIFNLSVLNATFNLNDLPDGEIKTTWIESIAKACAGERVKTQISMRNPIDNQMEFYEVIYNPIYDISQNVISVGCYVRNITMSVENEELIRQQLDKLKEISWIQSHTLRSPLTNIMGLVSLVQTAYESDNKELIMEILPLLQQSCFQLDDIIKTIVAKTTEVVE